MLSVDIRTCCSTHTHTLTSSEARYTHRCATSSAVHILPFFCLAIKSLKAWVREGQVKSVGSLQEALMLQQSPYLFRVCLGLDSSSQGWSIDSTWKKKIRSVSHPPCGFTMSHHWCQKPRDKLPHSARAPIWTAEQPKSCDKQERELIIVVNGEGKGDVRR